MKKPAPPAHVLLPKHSKMSEREQVELFKHYSISPESLPRILKSDAALLGMDVKTGDVIKIVRRSPTAGTALYYRVVADE